MANRDEFLNFVARVQGKDQVLAMGEAFDVVAAAAAAADPKAQALLDEIERLSKTEQAVSSLAGLAAKLQETGDRLFLARNHAAALEKEFNNTLEPTRQLTRDLARARDEVARLAAAEQRTTAELTRAQNAAKAAGYDIAQLGKAHADARARMAQAVTDAKRFGDSVADVGQKSNSTTTVLGRLRGIVAGVFAGLSLRGAAEGVKDIAMLGDKAEKTRNQFAQMYGSMEAGLKALKELSSFSSANGLALDATQASAAKLKSFGIDPLAGALRALVDQNAAAGGSLEDLNGKILAVGQAWAKEKLQGEEILQLIERGVPVWQLLQAVTGKNVAELQKLSEAGKLGRKEIAGLLAEIGKMNEGAAAKNAGTLSGLFDQLTGRVREFFTTVANSGTLDYFKGQLAALNQRMADMAKSGELAKLAKSISDGIIATGQAIGSVVGIVRDYGSELLTLARAYAVFKGASVIAGFAKSTMASFDAMAKSTAGATGAVGKFKAAASNIGAGVQFALLAAATDFAVGRIEKLVAVTQEYLAVQADLRERQAELVQLQSELARRAQIAAEQYKSAGKVQIATQDELQRKTRLGMVEYIRQLEDAVRLNEALRRLAKERGDSEAVSNLTAGLRDLGIALTDAKAKLETLGGDMSKATGAFARQAVKDFEAATAAGANAVGAIAGMFDKLDVTTPQGVKDLVETLAVVGPRAKDARAAIEGELVVALQKLSGEELRTFQANATKAFEAANLGAKDSAAVMNGALGAALAKLGVDAAKAGVAFTESGREIIATFKAVTENAQATSAQITLAFNQALAKVTTKQEAEALGAAIKAAGETGRVGIDQAKDAATALALRLREIAVEIDPLADQFARFGIKSKAELEATRDAAEQFYLAVVEGARKGRYAQDDVRAAFVAYAEAARAAVVNSTAAAREQVEAQLRARAAALGVTDALGGVGAAGQQAGADVAAGAGRAAAALDELGDSADKAADSAGNMGASADGAAEGLRNVADAGREAAGFALDMSAEFANAAAGLNGLDRITFALAQEQQRQAQELLASLKQQNLAYDENAQRIEALRQQFSLLGESQIQQLAREQELLDRNLDKRREQANQQRTDNVEPRPDQSQGGQSGGVPRGPVQLEIVHKVQSDGAGSLNQQQFNGMLEETARSGKLARVFNDSIRQAMQSAGAGGGR